MQMNFKDVFEIQDLGNHSALTVIDLGILLAGEADVRPDHKRKDLYEIASASTVYYVYISPLSQVISLIASWPNTEPPRSPTRAEAFITQPSGRSREVTLPPAQLASGGCLTKLCLVQDKG